MPDRVNINPLATQLLRKSVPNHVSSRTLASTRSHGITDFVWTSRKSDLLEHDPVEGKERAVKRGEEKGSLGICNRVSERRDTIGLTTE